MKSNTQRGFVPWQGIQRHASAARQVNALRWTGCSSGWKWMIFGTKGQRQIWPLYTFCCLKCRAIAFITITRRIHHLIPQTQLSVITPVVMKAGKRAGIYLRLHDLRWHAATFASRFGVLIGIISKIILCHANWSTTQIHLWNINDIEARNRIETLYGW